jgi:hypothetical protein
MSPTTTETMPTCGRNHRSDEDRFHAIRSESIE